jgi:hypothetical protein
MKWFRRILKSGIYTLLKRILIVLFLNYLDKTFEHISPDSYRDIVGERLKEAKLKRFFSFRLCVFERG